VKVDLQWMNNLPAEIRDANIEVEIIGNAQEESSINIDNGFYKTSSKKIVWNASSIPELSSLKPGSVGKARFTFDIKRDLPMVTADDKNFSINIRAKITGIGTYDQFENAEIGDSELKTIKVASGMNVLSKALYHTGHFTNSGPVPPQVDKETKYTIIWSLSGNSNDFSNVKVSGVLPSYMQWLNVISPADADLKFNKRGGVIVWNVGYVPAGTGTVLPAKEVAFQVSLLPGLNQEGDSPVLLEETKLESYDNFVNSVFTNKDDSVNTMIYDDPEFKFEEGKVIK
jgi:hypothetical protein